MEAKVLTGMTIDLTVAEEMLSKIGARLFRASLKTEDEIIAQAADADAVLAGPVEPFTKQAIAAMKKCKVISRYGIGYSNIDVDEATRQGIPVAVVLDASVHEVSDHTLAFVLAFSRKIFPLAQAARSGAWRPESTEIIKVRGKMFRLNRQTLGLVGMGRIGGRVAQKAKAFGLRVLIYDPYISSEDARNVGAEAVDFERILQESDFIALHAPLTPDTNKLFGLKEFRKMKPSAFIINTSRGGLIDEKALYQAVSEGEIAGAGLDVTDPEPPQPDSPLLNLEQVLVTGHSAWFSETSNLELQQFSTEAVIEAIQGRWPANIVNPDVQRQSNCRIAQGPGN